MPPRYSSQTTVLLVEDTPSDAEIVKAYLEDQRQDQGDLFNVIHAPDMETALRMMATIRIHAVMLDLFLPDTQDLSGLESIRTLLPSVPVLILTGRDDEDTAFRAVETGAQDYLLKDKINPRMLRRSIRYAMQRKVYEDKITYQAHFDSLTQLPNRQHFKDRVDMALARAQRTQRPLAVMMLDLDGFKDVNDTYGHDAGDRVLCDVAKKLTGCLRTYDVAARYGGDEFLVLIEEIARMEDLTSIATKLIEAVQRPLVEPMREIRVGTSIGIALLTNGEALSHDILLHRADQALYKAKRMGKGQFVLYSPAIEADSSNVVPLRS